MREETTTIEDRLRRTISKPVRYGYDDFVCLADNAAEDVDSSEPRNYQEAMQSAEANEWMLAMNEEMQSLQQNQIWNLVKKSTAHNTVGCKWVFKKKEGVTKSDPIKFKARLVAKGFTQ